jgi:hypothetical protein
VLSTYADLRYMRSNTSNAARFHLILCCPQQTFFADLVWSLSKASTATPQPIVGGHARRRPIQLKWMFVEET